MTATLLHRGPDDEGYYVSDQIGLGFRRLSIIDLEGGHQPMSDPEGSVWVVFNGEIYNFPELRVELEKCGYRFRTKSDTEVIVHGYKQWGPNVLDHLNGMFGVAIWDPRQKQLLIARDRLGIKLIYYTLDQGRLLFGSEIRPIFAALGHTPDIDPFALKLFLRHRYTPSPYTIYQGIRKLPAGTRLIVKHDHEPRLERWWNFEPAPLDPMPSDREAAEILLELYEKAVRRQLLSDVPLGLLLSGGIDSALLLALMKRVGDSRNTYTVGYGETYRDDELADAARAARMMGSPNIPVRMNRTQFEQSLPKIVRSLEEPVATSSIVPMYHVSERARQDVKVALMGQGPDELFGGYGRHLGVHYGTYWRHAPGSLRHAVRPLLKLLPRNEAIKRALYSLDVTDRVDRYQQVLSILPAESVDALFHDGLVSNQERSIRECWRDLERLLSPTDELGGLQFLELRSSLPDELLMYADKLSMAHGLEVRVPYLDHTVVEFVERLGATFKIRRGIQKWLHRKVAGSFLPPEVLNARKRGFASTVVDGWFKDTLSVTMTDVFFDDTSLMYKYLQPQAIQRLFVDHRAGKADNHKILFSLVVLEQLLRQPRNQW